MLMVCICMAGNEGYTFTDETLLSNVLAGMASGGIASAVANPTDVLKVMVAVMLLVLSISACLFLQVRMQSASDSVYSKRRSCVNFFKQIYREEGFHGLYRVRVLWGPV